MSVKDKEEQEKLLELIHQVAAQDKALREKYQIGDKFRFIRDRIHALQVKVEESLTVLRETSKQAGGEVHEDEMLVFVYLYNAQGLVLQTWQKMLNPSVFYEYSINRPIYLTKSDIEAFIRGKVNRSQHAYLTVIIKKNEIVKVEEKLQDASGHVLTKVKEGSLRFERMVTFTHGGVDYVLNESGLLIKK